MSKLTNEEYGNQSVNTFDYVEVRNLGGAYDKTPKKHVGMTLRQHYAGLAMQGLMSNPEIMAEGNELGTTDIISKMAVQYSDALIAQLNQQDQQ